MAHTNRTFRIFVSSTFSDLVVERDALQRKVFPRLREHCMARGARFQAIDLRWGVSEEASLDQQTMTICLEEISRCRRVSPRVNFVVLLGDRYGSRLLPTHIPAEELEAIISHTPPAAAELLNAWFLRDDNAVPPEYVLQPRAAPYDDPAQWAKLERELRDILITGSRNLPAGGYDPILYQASATEREIIAGALTNADAGEHVHCFFRSITNLDALVADVPRTDAAQDQERRARSFVDVDDYGRRDTAAEQDLVALKNRLRAHLPAANIHEYQAVWTGLGITTDHLSLFCADVYASLVAIIDAELVHDAQLRPMDMEAADQEAFCTERSRHFTGREYPQYAIASYLDAIASHPLVISGAPGSGKSALLARAYQQAREDRPESVVMARFIGATAGSSDTRALLDSLCRQIARHYDSDESAVPADLDGLIPDFSRRLERVTAEKPLLLFLDALDQLGSAERSADLSWLPTTLPPNVYLVASCSYGPTFDSVERRLPSGSLVSLEMMSPDEGEELLHAWLADAHRKLTAPQSVAVIDKFTDNGLPLYLKLAYEEARRWRSYTPIKEITLGDDIPSILDQLFTRLAAPANHGRLLVERSLGYLGAAKNGLSEDELLDILSLDPDVLPDFRLRSPMSPFTDRLPVVVWSRLYFDLEPYLAERISDSAILLTFYHRELADAINERYLHGDQGVERHRALAGYFAYQDHMTKSRPDSRLLRSFAELPFQQTLGALWDDLFATLTNFTFLEQKAATGEIVSENLAGVSTRTYTGIYSINCRTTSNSPSIIGVPRTANSAVHRKW